MCSATRLSATSRAQHLGVEELLLRRPVLEDLRGLQLLDEQHVVVRRRPRAGRAPAAASPTAWPLGPGRRPPEAAAASGASRSPSSSVRSQSSMRTPVSRSWRFFQPVHHFSEAASRSTGMQRVHDVDGEARASSPASTTWAKDSRIWACCGLPTPSMKNFACHDGDHAVDLADEDVETPVARAWPRPSSRSGTAGRTSWAISRSNVSRAPSLPPSPMSWWKLITPTD